MADAGEFSNLSREGLESYLEGYRVEIEQLRGDKKWLETLVGALHADRELHAAGRCTCHGEGSCIWCRWALAAEERDCLERELEIARREIGQLKRKVGG